MGGLATLDPSAELIIDAPPRRRLVVDHPTGNRRGADPTSRKRAGCTAASAFRTATGPELAGRCVSVVVVGPRPGPTGCPEGEGGTCGKGEGGDDPPDADGVEPGGDLPLDLGDGPDDRVVGGDHVPARPAV